MTRDGDVRGGDVRDGDVRSGDVRSDTAGPDARAAVAADRAQARTRDRAQTRNHAQTRAQAQTRDRAQTGSSGTATAALPADGAQPAETATTRRVDLARGTGRPPFTAVLWDLDGTIADSATGIIAAMSATFAQLGLPIPPADTLADYVGPPLSDSLRAQGLRTPGELAEAVRIYRSIQRANGLDTTLPFPGMIALVRDVAAAGIPQSLATSKNESLARSILAHFEITDSFTAVAGATEDESRSTKAEVVEVALERLVAAGADLSNVVMVGDRDYDMRGALAHGIPPIYVTWGYGHIGEEDGAVGIAASPDHLRTLLGV